MTQKRGYSFIAFIYLFILCSIGFTQSLKACSLCGSSKQCNLKVKNYNTRLDRVTGQKNLNIIQITMDGKKSPDLSVIVKYVKRTSDFLFTTSREKFKLNIKTVVALPTPVDNCARKGQARKLVEKFKKTLPDAFITVCQWPNKVCGYSNAGAGKIWMKKTLLRTYIHETGHS